MAHYRRQDNQEVPRDKGNTASIVEKLEDQ
jgi:hypothetical protein